MIQHGSSCLKHGSSCLKHGKIAAMFLLTTSFVPGPSCANALPDVITAVSSTYNNTTETDMSNDNTNNLPDVFTAVSTTYNNTTETNMSNGKTNKTESSRSRLRSGYNCDPNKWDGPQYCLCNRGERISVFESRHDNSREDRIWKLQCAPLEPDTFSVPDRRQWFTEQPHNAYDGWQRWYGIDTNSFLVGMKSHHHNDYEDRQYTLFTARSANWALNDCSGWIGLNNFDEEFSHTLGPNEVIATVLSMHANHEEDRLFSIKVCKLIQKCTVLRDIDYDIENAINVETKGVFACRATLSNSGNTAASTIMCQVTGSTAQSLAESYTFSMTSGYEVGLSLSITAGYTWGPVGGHVSATIGFDQKWSTSNTWSRSKSKTNTDSSSHMMRYTGTCAAGCDCTLEATVTRAVADIPYTLTSWTPGTGEICTEKGILKVSRTMNGVATMKSNCKETPCSDKYSVCAKYAEYCTSWSLMIEACPKTCKIC